jgi:hypothetical protein
VITLAIEGTALRGLIESDDKLATRLLAQLARKVRELDRQLLDGARRRRRAGGLDPQATRPQKRVSVNQAQ